jgi:enamine deaminase RidA (YjgF/YER057c/UK114 family)
MGSQAVQAGDFVFLGGQIASDYQNGLAPEVKRAGNLTHPIVSAKNQTTYVLKNAQAILKAAGSSIQNGVRIDQAVTLPEVASPYLDTRKKFVPPEIRPASTNIQVEGLLVPGAMVGVEMIAVTDRGQTKKEIVDMGSIPKSPGGPFAGGPQGVMAGDFVFLTGQIASDFRTGIAPEAKKNRQFWYGSEIRLQTEYVLKRLEMVLEEAGSSLQSVVKADIWLMNMDDVYEFDEVWAEYFPDDPPARTVIPVSGISDVDCLIEINMIAVRDKGKAKKKSISVKGLPATAGEPHAIRAGDFVFLSGIQATDSRGGIAPEARVHPEMPWFGCAGRMQTDLILDRMAKVCRAAGTNLSKVVWTQNFYTDLRDFQGSLESWQRCFPKAPPASFVCAVKPPHRVGDGSILIDAVAVV